MTPILPDPAIPTIPVTPATPNVSALYAGALNRFLQERGLPPAILPPTGRVAGAAYARVMQHGMQQLADRSLGLAFGTRVGAAGFGLLGIAAATAPNLRTAIWHLIRLESITCTLGHVQMQQHGKAVQLHWRAAPGSGLVPAQVIEGILAGWVSFGRYLLGEQVPVAQVTLAHPRHATAAAYDELLACPVRFAADGYSVTFATDLLDARPRHADLPMNAALTGWLRHCAHAVTADDATLTRQIAGMLGEQIRFEEANEQSVAAQLGVHVRQLQRRLQHEGTRFRHVHDAARAQHAILALLQGSGTLVDLAAEVGFHEQSSLCRSFRKWTGYAPLAFRQRLAHLYAPLRGLA